MRSARGIRARRAAACAAALLGVLGAASALARTPALATQPNGPAGCIASRVPPSGGCSHATTLAFGSTLGPVAISPNGRYLYAVDDPNTDSHRRSGGRILVFARNSKSGALRQLAGRRGCLQNTRVPVTAQNASCELVGGIQHPDELVISPDGRLMLATTDDQLGDYVTTFALDPRTGVARELQCLSSVIGSSCRQAPLNVAYILAVSPDSRAVYVGSLSALASGPAPILSTFRVGPRGLTYEQCLADGPVPGMHCTVAPLLDDGDVAGLAITPDGSIVYAAVDAENGLRIVALARDGATGLLAALPGAGECVSNELAPPAGCAAVPVVGAAIAMSPDGNTLYTVATPGAQDVPVAVAAFGRGAPGALSNAGCVVFAQTAPVGCSAAPDWDGVNPVVPSLATIAAGLLVGYEAPNTGSASVALVSPQSSTLGVSDVRGCAVLLCNSLRGPWEGNGVSVAVSADGSSLYVADGSGIAQLRAVGTP